MVSQKEKAVDDKEEDDDMEKATEQEKGTRAQAVEVAAPPAGAMKRKRKAATDERSRMQPTKKQRNKQEGEKSGRKEALPKPGTTRIFKMEGKDKQINLLHQPHHRLFYIVSYLAATTNVNTLEKRRYFFFFFPSDETAGVFAIAYMDGSSVYLLDTKHGAV